jgi:hypothetical protein
MTDEAVSYNLTAVTSVSRQPYDWHQRSETTQDVTPMTISLT